jgi:L-threonylcarbamoyladenylate synthase
VTLRFRIDPDDIDHKLIEGAADLLRAGRLVAFPTETVYGLGCIATDAAAVDRVFEAKGRPANDPLIVHVRADADLTGIVDRPPDLFWKLAKRWWPGPLTMVVGRGAAIPPRLTAGLETVAVRAPDHPIADALLEAVGKPVAAPSANRFGHVSPTTADHVLVDLAGRCDLVIDGGDSTLGIESTVVLVEADHVIILRHGALPVEELEVPIVDAPPHRPLAPGMAPRHYAPDAELWVMDPARRSPLPAGPGTYLGYDETVPPMPEGWRFVPLGARDALGSVAARLFRVLRMVDDPASGILVAELCGRPGLGRAIDDRLVRAAEGRFVGGFQR